MAPFALRLEGSALEMTVWASGELDLASADELRSTLVAAACHPRRRVVLDLTAVDFLDGSALGAIIGARRDARGAVIVLRHPNRLVTRVLRLTRLDEVFEIVAEPGPTPST